MPDSNSLRVRWWESRNKWLWFLLTFILFTVHLQTSRFEDQYYDAEFYWLLAKSFDVDGGGQFSIYNFDTALRGYLYPLLNYPATVLVRESLEGESAGVIKFLGALWAGALFGVVCPALWEKVTGRPVTALRRLLFIVVCFVLWRDYFNFTLTDFPSTLVLFTALLLLYQSTSLPTIFAVGALVAAAVYMRPLYLLSVPFVLALLVQQLWVQHRQATSPGLVKAAVSRILVFAAAFLLVGAPQYLINTNSYNSNSYLVLAEGAGDVYSGKKQSLYLFLLKEGVSRQRYESNVGPTYPKPQVSFFDPEGKAMLAEEGRDNFDTYGEYFAFVGRHPVGMLKVYVRHFFNGLDLLYSGPYIYNIFGSTLLNRLVVYTVLFVALLVIVRRIRAVQPRHWLLLAAILITCLASVPLIIECRFLIPLHLLLYAVAFFGWPTEWTWRRVKLPQLLLVGLGFGLFMWLCFTVSATAQQQMEFTSPTAQVQ
ncbi:hypothetical protein [Hymenobacter metallicola]|uniref:Glycosyltransferase RgtA/B/C/D-like domain-containing protein n=1 Tax=Hymenobacter metallicola TaxID=2563114 RepID=A0A4Z0Q9U4_9BACT|nr:hypothetical protein [Hymenobacter metallicola]TGE26495.1 hypothetical protein E5K02_17025 [Hymenobacter metallicola]